MNSTFRLKVGETRRVISVVVEETQPDGSVCAIDTDLIESATMAIALVAEIERNSRGELVERRLNSPGAEIERVLEAGDEDGEFFYGPLDEEYEEGGDFQPGRYVCVLDLLWTDGSRSPVPSVGVNYLVIEPRY